MLKVRWYIHSNRYVVKPERVGNVFLMYFWLNQSMKTWRLRGPEGVLTPHPPTNRALVIHSIIIVNPLTCMILNKCGRDVGTQTDGMDVERNLGRYWCHTTVHIFRVCSGRCSGYWGFWLGIRLRLCTVCRWFQLYSAKLAVIWMIWWLYMQSLNLL